MTSPTPKQDEPLTYGIDRGAPNGDKTALSIKKGRTVYTYVGDEAEAILELIDRTVAERLLAIIGEDETHWTDPWGEEHNSITDMMAARNELRAELRTAAQQQKEGK